MMDDSGADALYPQLRRDEGERLYAYKDSRGYLTIGVGRLIDQKLNGGITREESTYLLTNDVNAKDADLDRELPWTRTLDGPRRGAMRNMCFNLGITRLKLFTTFLELMRTGQFEAAARDLIEATLWAKQVGDRAVRIADQIRLGVWQ
jgi:lysozyme